MAWKVTTWTLTHAEHGTYFIGAQYALSNYAAQRVYRPDPKGEPLCERLGDYATLESAKQAVSEHIRELDEGEGHVGEGL